MPRQLPGEDFPALEPGRPEISVVVGQRVGHGHPLLQDLLELGIDVKAEIEAAKTISFREMAWTLKLDNVISNNSVDGSYKEDLSEQLNGK